MTVVKKLFTLVVPFMKKTGGSTRSLLLGKKLRGFGAGLINGFGGKVEMGEGVVPAAVRELQEESGIRVTIDRMRRARCGRLHFLFHADGNSNVAGDDVDAAELAKLWEVHVFFLPITEEDAEHIGPSDEMQPEWFDEANLPYTSMWEDDQYWYPHMLNGEPFDGICHFQNSNAPSSSPSAKPTWSMRSHDIRMVAALEDELLLR